MMILLLIFEVVYDVVALFGFSSFGLWLFGMTYSSLFTNINILCDSLREFTA
jgi:hypothetical protein